MSDKIYNVLFLCSANSARSIIAEVVLNQLGKGRFRAFSAGSQPSGAVHPLTLKVLQGQGYDTGTLRSKSWGNSPAPMRRRWTSCSRCATRPPVRSVRCGPVSR